MPVRTTLTVEDDLLRIARKRATESDRTLKDVVNEALRAGLLRPSAPASRRRHVKLPVFRGGRIQPGVDLSSNSALLDLMDGL